MKFEGYLFDLNGTMVDDMPYHIKAWHAILNNLGATLSIEEVKKECYGKNHELLERIFPGRFSPEDKDRMSLDKEKEYQAKFKPALRLLPGLDQFLSDSHRAGVKMAIGSAAIRFNIDFVLDNLDIRHYFDAIVSADDVAYSKPHPETWISCAKQLGISAEKCLVFEDAPKGVEAAQRANMYSHVLTTMHRPEEFKAYQLITGFSSDFVNLRID